MSITINPRYLREFNSASYILLLKNKPLKEWKKGNLRRIKNAGCMMEELQIGNRIIDLSGIINSNDKQTPSIGEILSTKGKSVITHNVTSKGIDTSYNTIDSFIVEEFQPNLIKNIKSLIENGKSGFFPFYRDADACKEYIEYQNNIESQITNLFSDCLVSYEKLESKDSFDIVKVIKLST